MGQRKTDYKYTQIQRCLHSRRVLTAVSVVGEFKYAAGDSAVVQKAERLQANLALKTRCLDVDGGLDL